MPENSAEEKWFCRDVKSGAEDGPMDLIEMAGLLRAGDIAPETLLILHSIYWAGNNRDVNQWLARLVRWLSGHHS